MATSAVWIKVDEPTLRQKLHEVRTALAEGEGEVLLDFSSVQRITTDALKQMEELAKAAGEKHRKVALSGVNVDVYKVLKVARLAERFAFVN